MHALPLTPRTGTPPRRLLETVAACVFAVAAPALAQTSPETQTAGASATPDSSWWTPGSGRIALGLNVGRSTFQAPCGSGFACDDNGNYWTLYGRGMATPHWGGEVAFVDMGRMERAGGSTRARGLNVGLIGQVPIASTLAAFGKVGAVYGRTRTSTGVGATIAGGNDNGFGVSLGAGLSWDLTPQVSAVLAWDRYDFRFRSGRDAVHTASVGLMYRY